MDGSDYEEHASFINEQFRPMELAEICCRLTTDHAKEVQRLNDCIQQLTHQISRKNETIECLLRNEEEYFVLLQELKTQIQYYKDRLEKMIDEQGNQSTVNVETQTDPVWKVKAQNRDQSKETLKWMPLLVFWIMLVVKLLVACRAKSYRTRETNTNHVDQRKTKSIKYKIHRKIKVSFL